MESSVVFPEPEAEQRDDLAVVDLQRGVIERNDVGVTAAVHLAHVAHVQDTHAGISFC